MGNSALASGVCTVDFNDKGALQRKLAGFTDEAKDVLRQAIKELNAEDMGITAAQLGNVQTAFEAIDMNQNGYIELDEFAVLLKALGVKVTDEECEGVFKGCLVDGKFPFQQFLLLIADGLRLQLKAKAAAEQRIRETPDGREFTISFEINFKHIDNWYIEILHHQDMGDGHVRLFCHGNHPHWAPGPHQHEDLAGLMKLSIKGGTRGGDNWGDLCAPKRIEVDEWHSIVITKTRNTLTFGMDGEQSTMETNDCEVKFPEHITPGDDPSVPEAWKEDNRREKKAGRKLFHGKIRKYRIQYGPQPDMLT